MTPRSISIVSPPDDISNIGCKLIPRSKPRAPNISRIAVSAPNFSSPNRLNSIFMFVVAKYQIPKSKNDTLEITIRILRKVMSYNNLADTAAMKRHISKSKKEST